MSDPPSQPEPPEQPDPADDTRCVAKTASPEDLGPTAHIPLTLQPTQVSQSSIITHVATDQATNLKRREPAMPRGAGLTTAVALLFLFGIGVLLRWLSFATGLEAMASVAAMILFAPATYVLVYLGWTVKLSLRHVLTCLLAFAICFMAWNAVMLPGLSADGSWLALQVNSIHWTTFLLSGCISLRFLQWITGVGIATGNANPLEPKSLPGKFSISKLLIITAACGLCVEGMRRSELLTPFLAGFSEPSTSERRLQRLPEDAQPQLVFLTEDWFSSTLWSLGALGGLFLGIHWTVLAALRHAGSYRTAGIIVWIAIAFVVRWYSLDVSAWEGSMALPLINATAPDDVYYSMIVLNMSNETTPARVPLIAIEAILQTALAWIGLRWFAQRGYPIRFLRHGRRRRR